MLFSPLPHIDSGLLPSYDHLDVDQEPAGPQVYLMSMSLTTEPSNDGPSVTEGFIHHYYLTYLCTTCPCAVRCVTRVQGRTYSCLSMCRDSSSQCLSSSSDNHPCVFSVREQSGPSWEEGKEGRGRSRGRGGGGRICGGEGPEPAGGERESRVPPQMERLLWVSFFWESS